jgi:hypothetical protein
MMKRFLNLAEVLMAHATWEAEIRRIKFRGQLKEIVCKTPSSKNQSKMDWSCGSRFTKI